MRVVLARGAVAADAGPDDGDDDGAPTADGAAVAGASGVAGGALVGLVWQRVRAAHRLQPRWARRHLLLAHNLLYAYRSPESSRASCMVYLCGFTAACAGEVRSRQHAFKVYHTGAAFYFATDSRRHTAAWLALIQRAALLPPLTALPMELSKQYSETEYSTDSGSDVAERERERDRDREKDKDRDKDKSKFGSLKKLTGRSRADSAESVAPAPPAAASLDRKYLRFFSRRRDDKHKNKQSGVPVPTEHYRSYRRAEPSLTAPVPLAPAPPPAPRPPPARLPKPINYIHASNPNLLDFEASSYVSRPSVPALPARRAADSFAGFVTLEEFMLKKQEEERRQVYTNRVLMGIERTRGAGGAGGGSGGGGGDSPRALEPAIHERLQRIVPDVIYGELTPTEAPLGSPPAGGNSPQRQDNVERSAKLVVKGKDVRPEAGEGGPERWRDSLRRNDKVHSGSAGRAGVVDRSGPEGGVSRLRLMFSARPPARAPPPPPAPPTPPCGPHHTPPMTRPDRPTELSAGGGAGLSAVYPHLQCPPTFQPETYSLQPPPSHPHPHPANPHPRS